MSLEDSCESVAPVIELQVAAGYEVVESHHQLMVAAFRENRIWQPSLRADICEEIVRTSAAFGQELNGMHASIVSFIQWIGRSLYAPADVRSHEQSLLRIGH